MPLTIVRASRICPGRELANETLFMVVVCSLWALNIEPVCGSENQPILPSRNDLVDEGIAVYVFNPSLCDETDATNDAVGQSLTLASLFLAVRRCCQCARAGPEKDIVLAPTKRQARS